MKISPRRSRLLVIIEAILFIVSLLAAPAGVANTYYGKIWGRVTVATDSSRAEGATLPLFGINAPVFEGDAVSGFYSYESLTRDADLSLAQNVNITLTFGNPANMLPYIGGAHSLNKFEVSAGNLTFFSVLDTSGTDAFTFMSISEHGFYFVEDVYADPYGISRVLSGNLNTSSVPEAGSTLALSFLALGALFLIQARAFFFRTYAAGC